jgi:hypothetical protein
MPITDIKIGVSRLFILNLAITISASLFTICLLKLGLGWKLILMLSTLSYGLSILWQDCLLNSTNSLTSLHLNHDGWKIVTAQQAWTGQLSGDSTLTTLASALRFNVAGRKRKLSCVIYRDSLEPNHYRQLLVLLRTTHARQAEQIRRERNLIK